MTIRIHAVLAALASVSTASLAWADASPTPTNDATPSAPAASAPAHKKAADPNLDSSAVVCKREDTTGTRLGASKVCHTRAEWAARADDSRQAAHHYQDSAVYH